jgi:ADP-ribosyl-[dinitrogen reductase] hydrolase
MRMNVDRPGGTVWGLAWGDIYGCPIEGWTEAEIRDVFGEYRELPAAYPRTAFLGRKPDRFRPPGLHSDDTQQALGLLHVCLHDQGFTPQHWAEFLVEGFKAKAWRGYGRNFARAVHKLKKRVSPSQSGSPSSGIGAAMRIAPVGALFHDNLEKLEAVVVPSSVMTHAELPAAILSLGVAFAVAKLVSDEKPMCVLYTLPEFLEAAESRWMRQTEYAIDISSGHLLSGLLRTIVEANIDSMMELRRLISSQAQPHLPPGWVSTHPNKGIAILGGVHALTVALIHPAPPDEVLREIVQLGGDTDTVGAICGAILGARYGPGWVPRDRILDAHRIGAYAEAVSRRSGPPESAKDFFEVEAKWTRTEIEFQSNMMHEGGLHS